MPGRAIKIVAWQEDVASPGVLKAMPATKAAKSALVSRAIAKIESLQAGL